MNIKDIFWILPLFCFICGVIAIVIEKHYEHVARTEISNERAAFLSNLWRSVSLALLIVAALIYH